MVLSWQLWQNTIISFEYFDFWPKNLYNFVSLPWKIDNPYYHIWQSSIKLSSLFPCFTSKLVCASHPKRHTLGCRNLKTSQMQQFLVKKFVKTLVKKILKKIVKKIIKKFVKKFVKQHKIQRWQENYEFLKLRADNSSLENKISFFANPFKSCLCLSPIAPHFGLLDPKNIMNAAIFLILTNM